MYTCKSIRTAFISGGIAELVEYVFKATSEHLKRLEERGYTPGHKYYPGSFLLHETVRLIFGSK